MKHIRTQRLLLSLVIFIWAGVAFRYGWRWSWDQPEPELPKEIMINLEWGPPQPHHLDLDFEDPFRLSEQKAPDKKSSSASVPRPTRIAPKKRAPEIPPIEFLGMIQGVERTAPLAMLRWQGKTWPIRVGDSLAGLRILAFGERQLQISWQDSVWILTP